MKLFQGIQFFLQLIKIKITNRGIPLTVIFNLSNRCNLKCIHCYASYHSRDTKKALSTKQIKSILEDLKRNGCLRVSFSGGEPLLHPDLEEIIDYSRGLGLSVTINTNGLLVSQKIQLLQKIDALAISLDGSPEHHDILRGPGVGEKVVKAIECAVQAGICVHTNTVMNRHNLGDVDYILDLARRLGIKAEFALAISAIADGREDHDPVKPTNDEFKEVLKYIIKKKKAGAPILFSAASYESVLNCWEDFSLEGVVGKEKVPGMPQCPAGRIFGIIDAEGTLCACPHLLEHKDVQKVSVLAVGVAEAWKIAGQHPCTSCYQVYHHEFALLQNLDPRIIANYMRQLF